MRLLHGRPHAERLNARSRERSDALQGRGIHPALAAISVGVDPAANTYLQRLVRGGRSLGIAVRDVSLNRDATEAALRGASLNVMINLASVKDPAQVKALSEDLDRALDGAEAQRKRITDFVETRIAR